MENVSEKISNLHGGGVIAIDVAADSIMRANVAVLKDLQAMGYEGVYVALSKNYQELSRIFGYAGVDLSKLFIIDGISNVYGSDKVDLPNVTYVDSPAALKAVEDNIKRFLDGMQGQKKFILLDSVTVLLLYTSFEQAVSLCDVISRTTKDKQCIGIIMSLFLGVPNKKMSDSLTSIVDEFVKF